MDHALRYSDTAKAQIRQYLDGIQDETLALAAIVELRRELSRLAADPGLGTAPTGPFETRPIYGFRLEAGDRRRLAQVSYRLSDDGSFLDVLLFSSVPV